MFTIIDGGVCAAKGFQAGAIHCGIRKSHSKTDLAMICSDVPCTAAAVYTKNLVKAAPLHVTKAHLGNGCAQAIIVNSGNANACAPHSLEYAQREAQAAATALGVAADDVIVASTGVIGQTLNIGAIESHAKLIEMGSDKSLDAAHAIMTTDTKEKTIAVEFQLGGVTCHLGGICKGSGMIHPNMGTMLCFITTDCAVAAPLLQKALLHNVKRTFNRISVDGDTSTNDMCCVLANGQSGAPAITAEGADLDTFTAALRFVMEDLGKKIAADGEGASRLLTCTVTGAADEAAAEALAKSVCSSSLTKAAMFGSDANWGRVLCAMGYSGTEFNPENVQIGFASADGSITVCQKGQGLEFDETLAKKILSRDAVEINIALEEGQGSATCWGCDLTYDYVKINGDYRT